MKLGSLFDGSGTCPLAAVLCGIEPVWASEIEKFPIEVTTKRFPNMKHLGDITKLNGAEIEPTDIITFGSPCQDLSVAGRRAGLNGERSNLFMEAVRIIREMREATNNESPRYIMWENVPGAFSSNKGYDFRTVLEEIAESEIPMPESGKWSAAGMVELPDRQIAWRVLDSQYWGVPQRRKRIFLVADFGGKCAGEILFKRESVYGYITQGDEARKRVTEDSENGIDETSRSYGIVSKRNCEAFLTEETHTSLSAGGGQAGQGYPCVMTEKDNNETETGYLQFEAYQHHGYRESEKTNTLTAGQNNSIRGDTPLICIATQQANAEIMIEKCPTITETAGTSGNNKPYVCIPINTQVALRYNALGERTGLGIGKDGDPAFTLQTAHSHGVAVAEQANKIILFEPRSQDGAPRIHKNIVPTLNTAQGGQRQPCVSYGIGNGQADQAKLNEKVAGTLTCMHDQQKILITDDEYENAVAFGESDLHNYKQDRISTLKSSGGCVGGGSETLIAGIDCRNGRENGDLCGTLQSKESGGFSYNCTHPVRIGYTVRRLTPTECARLQGFPDWWCSDIPHSDTAEYKMWGNGMSLPCVLYIMQNIKSINDKLTHV